jgi:hypothetical protein
MRALKGYEKVLGVDHTLHTVNHWGALYKV